MDDYSPTQMLDLCKSDHFRHGGELQVVTEILAVLTTSRDPVQLVEELKRIVRQCGTVSIGQSLETLHSVANIGPELDGGKDGLDALCYHLSGHACEQGITALQQVLQRFKRDQQ